MGLIFTTRGWSGAEIAVDGGVYGVETYTVTGDVHNAYDVAELFRAWLDDAARAWAGSLSSITWAVIDDGGRLAFAFAPVGTTFTSFTGNAVALTRIAVCKTSAGAGKSGVTRGSCSAVPGTVMWERWDTQGGARARQASWRMGHPQLSHRRPSCEFGLDLVQAYAFGEAVKLTSSPRTAYVYDEHSASWRFVSVGKHDLQPHRADDTTALTATLEILGGV